MKKQQQQKFGHDVRCKDRQLSFGNLVYAKNYGTGPMWLPGTVKQTIGSTMYEVRLNDGNTMRRHIKQLRPRYQPESADQHVNQDENVEPHLVSGASQSVEEQDSDRSVTADGETSHKKMFTAHQTKMMVTAQHIVKLLKTIVTPTQISLPLCEQDNVQRGMSKL